MRAPTPPPLPDRLKILLDQNAPYGLIRLLTEHEVIFAGDIGWSKLVNGELIKAAEEAGFHVMITADGNIRYQQNLASWRLAILWLAGATNWKIVRERIAEIRTSLNGIHVGGFVTVPIIDPARRRPPRRLLEPRND
jgi:hypothetical protein